MATPQALPLKSTSGTSSPTRRPFNGSCHCGAIKYIVYLTLPRDSILPKSPPPGTTPIYRCNCTVCTKMGLFHTRPINPPEDFILLSPLNPLSGGLQDYQTPGGNAHWFFCGTCGVRCFSFVGEGEEKDVEIEGKATKGWVVTTAKYLSVNAITLQAGQEGLDLREWTEKGWIEYYDNRNMIEKDQMGVPHKGDMY